MDSSSHEQSNSGGQTYRAPNIFERLQLGSRYGSSKSRSRDLTTTLSQQPSTSGSSTHTAASTIAAAPFPASRFSEPPPPRSGSTTWLKPQPFYTLSGNRGPGLAVPGHLRVKNASNGESVSLMPGDTTRSISEGALLRVLSAQNSLGMSSVSTESISSDDYERTEKERLKTHKGVLIEKDTEQADRIVSTIDEEQQAREQYKPQQQQERRPGTAPKTGFPSTWSSQAGSLSDSPSKVPSLSATDSLDSPSQPKSYIERKFDELLGKEVVDLDRLKERSWSGIPERIRADVWRMLLGYLPANRARRKEALARKRQEYVDILPLYLNVASEDRSSQEQETLRQILVDIPRTQPDIPLFHQEPIQRIMARVLYFWAIRHPASGYVQGMNDLSTPFILVFVADRADLSVSEAQAYTASKLSKEVLDQIEADVYWCFTRLLDNIQDHYTFSQPGLQRMILRLGDLVERHDRVLHRHFDEEGVQYIQFSFRWMNCLLMRELSLESIVRIWDAQLAEEATGFDTFHVYLCAALLLRFSASLKHLAFQDLILKLQDLPTHDWGVKDLEELLSQAHVLRTLYPNIGGNIR